LTNLKKYHLFTGLILASLVVLWACQKNVVSENRVSPTQPLQSWLKNNGQIFSEGQLQYKKGNGEIVKLKLEWSKLTQFKSGNRVFYQVPFLNEAIENSTGSDRTTSSANDELPTVYSMVFQEDVNGNIAARVKISVSNTLADKKFDKVDYFDNLLGNRDAYWMWKTGSTIRPVRVYAVVEKKIRVSKVGSVASNLYAVPTCQQYFTPVREYLCATISPETGLWSSTCGYHTVGFNLVTDCPPEELGAGPIPLPPPPSGSGGVFNYGEYYDSNSYEKNQAVIDSLTGYPCAQHILDSLLQITGTSCTESINSLFHITFGHPNGIDLRYSVKSEYTLDNPVNGYTRKGGGRDDWYNAGVYLNAGVLLHSSREYILSTIFHEGIHAVIDYWYSEYQKNRIDSNQFKSMFPIFWDYNRTLSDQELAHHNQIAQGYINNIKSVILTFNNNISDTMATALAWKGLQFTTAWKAKSDTNEINRLQHIARQDNADSTLITNYSMKKCN